MARSDPVPRPDRPARRAASRLLLVFPAALFAATALSLAAPLGWPFELFVHFRVQYAALGLALGIMLFAARRPKTSLLVILLSAFNALPVLRGAQADPPPAGCAGAEFTVVSANVQYGNGDRRRFVEWLAKHPADLVVVQEVTAAWARDLDRLPGYPYRRLLAREDPYGIGVLSRWPLDAVGPMDYAGDGLPSIAGRVALAGRSLRFLGLHTHWPITPGLARVRDRSLDVAARSIVAGTGQAVVLGDLNATPYSPAYSSFLQASGLRDAAQGSRWQPTWMAGFWPLALRIDHVFVSPGLCVLRAEVGPAIGSDHRPVVARLRFAG
jgi:endonuclease/exonuclease/phosphatase (EEP) superfamily protein YafD